MATGRRSSIPTAAPTPAATALFIADLGTELAALARAQHFELLAYFLDMAVMEADRVSKEPESDEDAA
jgi:hypothetical protein